jgi:hypothetical protein
VADPRLARPLWRGRTNVDALTISCIEHAEQIVRDDHPRISHDFIVTQGSYQGEGGDPDSGTTHSKGGAVDLRWCGHQECYLALREAGMFIWHRFPWQGDWPDHFHGAPIGHPNMDYRLAAQEVSYLNGGNGLGGTDDGPRLHPIPRPVWPWPPEDDMAQHSEQLNRIETYAKKAATEAERNRKGSYRRDTRLVKKLTAIGVNVRDLEKALAELDDEDET